MKSIHDHGIKAVSKAIAFLNEEEDHTQEELHQFRLAMKKLRFIIQLLIQLDLDNKHVEALNREIKPLFKAAGRIREFQLFRQMVHHLAEPGSQVTRLLEDEMNNEVAWSEIVFRKNMIGADQKLFMRFGDQLLRIEKHFPSGKLSARIRKVIKRQMSRWPMSHDQLKAADWHQLRREMKFVLAVMPVMLPEDQFSRPLRDILKHTAELIGEWHDHYDCLQWCRENMPDRSISPEAARQWLEPFEKTMQSRAVHFEKAYGALIEQLEFNEFLSGDGG